MSDPKEKSFAATKQVRIGIVIALSILGFYSLQFAWKWLSDSLDMTAFVSHSAMKTILVVLSLAIAKLLRIRLLEMGFRRSRNRSWIPFALGAVLLGAAATFCLLASGGGGIPMLKKMNPLQMIVSIWLVSSICEEIYVRGLCQTCIERISTIPTKAINTASLGSAVIFGAMHLSLISSGADWKTVSLIVTATTILGFLCAVVKQRTGSIFPSIYVHIAFNVGGIVGGIVNVILFGLPR